MVSKRRRRASINSSPTSQKTRWIRWIRRSMRRMHWMHLSSIRASAQSSIRTQWSQRRRRRGKRNQKKIDPSVLISVLFFPGQRELEGERGRRFWSWKKVESRQAKCGSIWRWNKYQFDDRCTVVNNVWLCEFYLLESTSQYRKSNKKVLFIRLSCWRDKDNDVCLSQNTLVDSIRQTYSVVESRSRSTACACTVHWRRTCRFDFRGTGTCTGTRRL